LAGERGGEFAVADSVGELEIEMESVDGVGFGSDGARESGGGLEEEVDVGLLGGDRGCGGSGRLVRLG